jgi:bla regulator protein BlaR1
MINWLINSTLCSGMLLMVYQLLLKNTSLFNFNRAYLLLSVLLPLLAPLVIIHQQAASLPSILTVPMFQGVPHSAISHNSPIVEVHSNLPATPVKADVNYAYYLWVAYCLVALLLLLRFFKNLSTIVKDARRSEIQRYGKAWLVLCDSNLVPHTFINRIFINKQAYNENKIEKSVLDHEMAHAVQFHSVDVIFIGLVQAVFWFNPFLLFFRKAIQLNHEFIADATAIRNSDSIIHYQELLLSKASLMSSLSITSQFNYSITKKRLIMMKKQTSATAAWCIRLTVVPVIAAAFLLFSSKTEAQQSPTVKSDSAAKTSPSTGAKQAHFGSPRTFGGRPYPSTKEGISMAEMDDYISYEKKYATRRLSFDKNMTTDDEKHLEQLYQRMSPEQQKDRAISFSYPPDPLEGGRVTRRQLEMFKDPVQYGVWVDDKRVDNAILNDLDPKKFCILMFSRLTPVAVKNDHFHYQITLMTKPYYKKYVENAIANRNHSNIIFHLKS